MLVHQKHKEIGVSRNYSNVDAHFLDLGASQLGAHWKNSEPPYETLPLYPQHLFHIVFQSLGCLLMSSTQGVFIRLAKQ